jgi:DNA-binding NarL/FixJ family response regulator
MTGEAKATMNRSFPPTVVRDSDTSATSATETPVRLLIVDGHPVTRWGLARIADDQPGLQIAGETGSAAEALRLAAVLDVDVVTIGIGLCDGNGLDLARELRDRYADLGIVILTSRGEDDVLFRAL